MTDASNPFDAMPDVLKPHLPGEIPEALGARDATAGQSPFSEALDVDQIISNLMLDRPLKLFIPNRERYPDWEFRIINSIASEIADARNKGFKEVTDPDIVGLFRDLVAGTDKDGKAFRPILCARPKQVGEVIRKRLRMQLASLYAGMDPKNKEMAGKYTAGVDAKDGTFLNREGSSWRIRA